MLYAWKKTLTVLTFPLCTEFCWSCREWACITGIVSWHEIERGLSHKSQFAHPRDCNTQAKVFNNLNPFPELIVWLGTVIVWLAPLPRILIRMAGNAKKYHWCVVFRLCHLVLASAKCLLPPRKLQPCKVGHFFVFCRLENKILAWLLYLQSPQFCISSNCYQPFFLHYTPPIQFPAPEYGIHAILDVHMVHYFLTLLLFNVIGIRIFLDWCHYLLASWQWQCHN